VDPRHPGRHAVGAALDPLRQGVQLTHRGVEEVGLGVATSGGVGLGLGDISPIVGFNDF